MARSPAIRVGAVRDMLDFLDSFEPGSRQRILALIPLPSREPLVSGPRSNWLPLEHNHWSVDAICATLGRERAIQAWEGGVLRALDRPLLRPFAEGMLRIFANNPSRLLSLMPQAMSLVYRDFFTLRVERQGDRAATVIFDDVAPEVARHPNYFVIWRGICQGYSRLLRADAHVHFVVAADMRSAEARFQWSGDQGRPE